MRHCQRDQEMIVCHMLVHGRAVHLEIGVSLVPPIVELALAWWSRL